ncbi:putative asparagine--tRNA ligase, mitochondrial [Orchesella cincta]|uniref:asparagine--tRNA ligase n=1 Tax=Orchesella cincta TaxID=48709 RepID=A0A1D2MH13_ORCCI|nr:putative asparagine--tRNA ligase, mitochondrial [Orchesella cincta]
MQVITTKLSRVLAGKHRSVLSRSRHAPGLSNLQQNFCRNCSLRSADKARQEYVADKEKVSKRSVKDVVLNGSSDEAVRIQGWVRSFRKLKENLFLDVSDGSSEHRVPVVTQVSSMPKGIQMHTSVDVTGVLQPSPKNPAILEIHPNEPIKLVGSCDQQTYPFGGKIRYTQDYIRQFIHLRPKTNKFSSLLRLRSATSRAINDYFTNNGFFQVHVPILTSNDCEGAGELFTVKPASEDLVKEMRKENNAAAGTISTDEVVYFDKHVHLSVSGQLHLESAVCGLEKVWTFSPVFRAENSKSSRHLAEFYMVEAEMAFAYEIEQILEVMENLVKSSIRMALTDCIGDWNVVTGNSDPNLRKMLDHMLAHPFTVMTFDEASKLLKEKASSIVQPGKGLSREQELLLVEQLNDNIPIFVIDWPSEIKPFYMRQSVTDSSKVSAVDLLVPTVGELCGGSLREGDVSKLTSKLNAMDPSGSLQETLSWYIDLRKYGGTPTGGFGLGFDRLMQLITGIGNIKDVSPFPRWPHHCPM